MSAMVTDDQYNRLVTAWTAGSDPGGGGGGGGG